jgi:hypothetical protein
LALNHIAQDKDSGEIWSDYIQFLKAAEVRDLFSTRLSEDTDGLTHSVAAHGKNNRRWMPSARLIMEPSKYARSALSNSTNPSHGGKLLVSTIHIPLNLRL